MSPSLPEVSADAGGGGGGSSGGDAGDASSGKGSGEGCGTSWEMSASLVTSLEQWYQVLEPGTSPLGCSDGLGLLSRKLDGSSFTGF